MPPLDLDFKVSEIVRVYNTTRLSQGNNKGTHTIHYTTEVAKLYMPVVRVSDNSIRLCLRLRDPDNSIRLCLRLISDPHSVSETISAFILLF